jgi:hydrogenase expression/formation protein HypE
VAEQRNFLAVGKLDMEFLAALLEQYAHTDDERVVIGPRVGEDALVVDFGDRFLVAKTDPITFATDEIGWYAVNVNANDIATTGATCRWFLATLLLPEGRTTKQLVETIFAQMSQACRSLGIALCGGHTEITYDLDRPIVVGHMLGEVEREALVTTDGMRVGDDLILTKGIAIEGTAIIAREKADALANKFPPEFIARCQGFLHDPGISVLAEACLATAQAHIHAMHDPTEGGVATGLRELALASDLGLIVDEARLDILPETALLCAEFGLDPLGLIASGSLLMALAPEDSPRVVEALRRAGIAASVIGKVVDRAEGLQLIQQGKLEPLPVFERDEIARLFGG